MSAGEKRRIGLLTGRRRNADGLFVFVKKYFQKNFAPCVANTTNGRIFASSNHSHNKSISHVGFVLPRSSNQDEATRGLFSLSNSKTMFVKILTNSWLCSFPVTSGGNQSFGPITISEFYTALKNVKKWPPSSKLEDWIKSSGFFKNYPSELVLGHTEHAFCRILNEYNKGTADFLAAYPNFYLWLNPCEN